MKLYVKAVTTFITFIFINDTSIIFKSRSQTIKKRYRNNVYFVNNSSTNFIVSNTNHDYCEWENTITIRLNASHNINKEYVNSFGLHFLYQDTLIITDEFNTR